jgi:hypothetical protein
MALLALSPGELSQTPTLFSSFMGSADRSHKTVGELLAIYRERSKTVRAHDDPDDDLRVDRFMADMAGDRWRGDVVVRIGVFDDTVLMIDGIHRSSAGRLPPLRLYC